MNYLVRYRYDNPSSAGPWKGNATMPDKYVKGDTIVSYYGRATVTSCRKAKQAIDRWPELSKRATQDYPLLGVQKRDTNGPL